MITPTYPLDREVSSRLLADPETSATALHVIVLTAYGDAVYGSEEEDIPPIDPVLLWALLREDFSVTVPEANENRINALMTALITDGFYEVEEVFVATCLALYNGDMGDIVSGFMEDITLVEALWGIFEVALNRNDDLDFHPRIVARIRAEMAEAVEETDHPFSYFVRGLIEGKTQIVRELTMLGAPDEAIAHVVNFDETPVHSDLGMLEVEPAVTPQ